MLNVILMANWGLGTEILQVLHRLQQINITSVVTQHKTVTMDSWFNAVWEHSNRLGCPTFSQEDLKFSDLERMVLLQEVDLLICHAFMRILPKSLYNAPKYGTINVHASLLPKYRGPSPTYWVLKNRETKTGLTCHFIDEELDSGDIIYQVELPVNSDDTVESVIEREKTIVEDLVIESIRRIKDPRFQPKSQDSNLASDAPRPF